MKPRIFAIFMLATALFAPVSAEAQAGVIDTTFGSNGVVITDVCGDQELLTALCVQQDGKVISVGNALCDDDTISVLVVRHNMDGTVDTDFGIDGFSLYGYGAAYDQPWALAIQLDQRIVVAGYNTNTTYGERFAINRLNQDGSMDSSFGNGGITITDFPGPGFDRINAVAIQEDEKILAAGTAYGYGEPTRFGMARYCTNGTLDSTFGIGGIASVALGSSISAEGSSLALQSDGKFVIAGRRYEGNEAFPTAIRCNGNGSIDPSFGSGGVVTVDLSDGVGVYYDAAIQPDGKVVCVGDVTHHSQDPSSYNDYLTVRYNTDGHLDSAFGVNGMVVTSLGLYDDVARSVIVQPDGKILVGGRVMLPDSNNQYQGHIGLVRYEINGGLDSSFGSDGLIVTGWDLVEGPVFWDMSLLPDGRIVVGAGVTSDGTGQDQFLIRYLNDLPSGIQTMRAPEEALKVNPNPADDEVAVNLTGLKGQVHLQLFDCTGRLSADWRAVGGRIARITVGEMPRGPYWLRASVESGRTSASVMVVLE